MASRARGVTSRPRLRTSLDFVFMFINSAVKRRLVFCAGQGAATGRNDRRRTPRFTTAAPQNGAVTAKVGFWGPGGPAGRARPRTQPVVHRGHLVQVHPGGLAPESTKVKELIGGVFESNSLSTAPTIARLMPSGMKQSAYI